METINLKKLFCLQAQKTDVKKKNFTINDVYLA